MCLDGAGVEVQLLRAGVLHLLFLDASLLSLASNLLVRTRVFENVIQASICMDTILVQQAAQLLSLLSTIVRPRRLTSTSTIRQSFLV